MPDAISLISLLVWLQIKHFIADYLLQWRWILEGKGDVRKLGGYTHAAIHAAGSLPALLALGLDASLSISVTMGEFVVHFTIDHFKAVHSHRYPTAMTAWAFWAAHGADQLLHQLTYATIVMIVMIVAFYC